MLVGRKEEKELLQDAYLSDESKFIAVYGRRRIGKTYLIREVFDYNFFFSHSGLANANSKKQIQDFCLSLKEQGTVIEKDVKDWMLAFSYLKRKIMSSNEKKESNIFR